MATDPPNPLRQRVIAAVVKDIHDDGTVDMDVSEGHAIIQFDAQPPERLCETPKSLAGASFLNHDGDIRCEECLARLPEDCGTKSTSRNMLKICGA